MQIDLLLKYFRSEISRFRASRMKKEKAYLKVKSAVD